MYTLELMYESRELSIKLGKARNHITLSPEHQGRVRSLGRAAGKKNIETCWAAGLMPQSLSEQDVKKTQPLSLELEKHCSGLFLRVFWKSEPSRGHIVHSEL